MQTVALLVADSPSGHDLAEKLNPLAIRLGFRLAPRIGFGLADFLEASTSGRLQIVDISRDCEGNTFDKVYPAPSTRALLVSRTYTPLNFRPQSVPFWDAMSGTQLRAFPEFGETIANDEIVAWLERKLPQFIAQSKHSIPLVTQIWAMMKSRVAIDEEIRKEGQIFLSYRSSSVAKIAELARQVSAQRAKTCRYFPPGMLSREAMSRMRRWNLLSLIDRYLASAEEVWTCYSDDYLHSWWTYGELVTATHRRTQQSKRAPSPSILRFRDGQVSEWSESQLPKITEAEHQRIARYYSFCDSYTMGPEAIVTHEGLQSLQLKATAGYYADEVWSREFWLNPIVECGRCRSRKGGYDEMPLEHFLWHRGARERDLEASDAQTVSRGNGLIELSFDALPDLALHGVQCHCGHRISLEPGPKFPSCPVGKKMCLSHINSQQNGTSPKTHLLGATSLRSRHIS
jgi:hypothetical protein